MFPLLCREGVNQCKHMTALSCWESCPAPSASWKDEPAKNQNCSIQCSKLSNKETELSHSHQVVGSPVLSMNGDFKNPGPVLLLPITSKTFSSWPGFTHPFTFLGIITFLHPRFPHCIGFEWQ